jgi:hypothetical protein
MVVSQALVRASRRMAFWSKVAVAVTPLTTIVLFLFPDQVKKAGGDFTITEHYGRLLANAVPLSDRLFALAVAMIPTAIATFGVYALVRLFRSLGKGEVFSPGALRAFCWIAAALFWNLITSIATEPAITWFLTRADALHRGGWALSLGYDDLELLFMAGVAYVIARAMAEARTLAEENAAFV